MEAFHLSDIHGDLPTLDVALNKIIRPSDAEVVFITGDLAGSVFDEEETQRFLATSKEMWDIYNTAKRAGYKEHLTLHSIAKDLAGDCIMFNIADEKKRDELVAAGKVYLNFEHAADERTRKQYYELRQRLQTLKQKIMLVPGNWDRQGLENFLAEYSIHGKGTFAVGGNKVAGYGGARGCPNEIPIDLLDVSYDEDEAVDYLSQQRDAEIILTHQGPRKFSKRQDGVDIGEYNMSTFLYKRAPSWFLIGHSHAPGIFRDKDTKVVVTSSGNLGRYPKQRYGTFLEMEIDKDLYVSPVAAYQVNDNQVDRTPLEEGHIIEVD